MKITLIITVYGSDDMHIKHIYFYSIHKNINYIGLIMPQCIYMLNQCWRPYMCNSTTWALTMQFSSLTLYVKLYSKKVTCLKINFLTMCTNWSSNISKYTLSTPLFNIKLDQYNSYLWARLLIAVIQIPFPILLIRLLLLYNVIEHKKKSVN